MTLDQGGWETAVYLLPERDALSRTEIAGTEQQLETIFNYRESLKKLRRAQGGGDGEKSDPNKSNDKGAGKAGKRKDAKKAEADGQ